MFFHVGPYEYKLVVSDRRIYDEEGQELEGLADEGQRLLIISPCVEPWRREEVGLHELFHAHQFHVPMPRTEEERCNLFALAAQQFRKDVESQGGAKAIEEMASTRVPHCDQPIPTRRIVPVTPEPMVAPDRRVCGSCESEIMCGSIHNGDPHLHQQTGQWRIDRWTICDACDTLMAWAELCTPDGTPLGHFVSNPPPRMMHGREARDWLSANVQMA